MRILFTCPEHAHLDPDRDAELRARIAAGARRVAESLTVEREIRAWDLPLRRACSEP